MTSETKPVTDQQVMWKIGCLPILLMAFAAWALLIASIVIVVAVVR